MKFVYVMSETGTSLWHGDYSAYGQLMSSTGNAANAPQFGYAGMMFHKSSGLNLTRFRAYNPNTGRWLSTDPIGFNGGRNLYGYVGGNPINFMDLLGLASCDDIMNLVNYEKEKGKLLTLLRYNPTNNDLLIPLNDPAKSIYGDVDLDWLFRISDFGVPYITDHYAWLAYLSRKVGWNTLRAISNQYRLEYKSLFEKANINAPYVLNKWLKSEQTLQDILKPEIDSCSCKSK